MDVTPIAVSTALAVLVSLPGCAARRPSDLPREAPWLIAVKSARLDADSAWYKRFAHHTWIDVKRGSDDAWTRLESAGTLFGTRVADLAPDEPYLNQRFGGRAVRVLGIVTGEEAKALVPRLVDRVRELNAFYDESYNVWPGPNSNTLVMTLARECPELRFVFDGNAAGKDYGGWFDAGLTSSKTGIRVDTIPFGMALAAREGIELHVLQLTLGIGFDPLCIKIPFLPNFPSDVGGGEVVELHPTGPVDREIELLGEATDAIRHPLGTLPSRGRLAVCEPGHERWIDVRWELVPIGPRGGDANARPATQGIALHFDVHTQTGVVTTSIDGYQLDLDRPTAIVCPQLGWVPWHVEWTRRADGTIDAILIEGPRFGATAAPDR